MSNSTNMFSEKIEYFVVGNKPINQDAIARAIYDYEYQLARKPKILRMESLAYRDLMRQLLPYEINFKTVLGLEIERDESLKKGEWRVGDSREILKTVGREDKEA